MVRITGGTGLALLAGPRALQLIRDGGLCPESVTTILGAAGGPKWLVLAGLDRAIFFSWLSAPKAPIELVGSSIGAWRFAAVTQNGRAADAHGALKEAYIHQRYDERPSAQDVTDQAVKIMDGYLTDGGARKVLENPSYSITILAVRGKGPFSRGTRLSTALGMVGAGSANALSRGSLGRFFVRTVFTDGLDGSAGGAAKALAEDRLPTKVVTLTGDNIRQAVLASGSIPLVMEGVRNIPGAPEGIYWDGGLVDYHVTVPDSSPGQTDGIVLFPHYTDRIVPGWFDKHLPWRGPSPSDLNRLVLVCPSREFVGRLPLGKIPDRTDFKRFFGHDRDRVAYWEKTADASEALGDEFLELVESGKIRQRVRPFPSN